MNAEVEAVTVKDHEVEGSQATVAAHAPLIEFFRTRQPCVVKA